ncbi:RHS Repeat protein [compost metagenome]
MLRKKKIIVLWLVILLMVGQGAFALPESDAAATRLYNYDSNGRLISIENSDGSVITYQYDRNGNLKKRIMVLGKLESPATTEASSSNISVKGWYLDSSGIDNIKVYIDNNYQGMAVYGDNREDIYNAYPSLGNHNSGYHFDADLPNVTKDYVIKVVIRNLQGTESIFTKTIHFTKLAQSGYLDSPTATATSPYLNVSGWYLDKSGVESIKVYVDDVYNGTAVYGDSREDVYNVFPQYGNHNSGYHLAITLPNVTKTYQIKVIVRNKDGEETPYTRAVQYTRTMSPVGYLDTPSEGESMRYYGGSSSTSPDNQMSISGWYLDVTPVKSIKIYVNGALNYTGNGSWATRTDVYNAYPQYNIKNSGFSVTIPKPPVGSSKNYGKTISYTLQVTIENNLGEQMTFNRSFEVYYENPTDPGSWT